MIAAALAIVAGCGAKVAKEPNACIDDPERVPASGALLSVGDLRIGLQSVAALDGTTASLPYTLVIFSEGDACTSLLADLAGTPVESRWFTLVVPHAETGVFPVNVKGLSPIEVFPPTGTAAAHVSHSCGADNPGASEEAVLGTVAVTVATPVRVVGKYDLTFPGGERVTGAFDTCYCSQSAPCSTPLE